MPASDSMKISMQNDNTGARRLSPAKFDQRVSPRGFLHHRHHAKRAQDRQPVGDDVKHQRAQAAGVSARTPSSM